eukprot:CAMPEP_0116019924 /NCGR_PEP_ID=MMETSP0321-20121206/9512_1 /TAXON_ID=163516 /ORGANISM="Leptocylindrus danicus var. danicus, Strain B650" /LENGTH=477 /DNA_ID=CAMNT_0003490559 /DNA_START=39 /DNA_END=1472 /DNA_ORIENTATION=+
MTPMLPQANAVRMQAITYERRRACSPARKTIRVDERAAASSLLSMKNGQVHDGDEATDALVKLVTSVNGQNITELSAGSIRSIPLFLGKKQDDLWLSDLHCFIRSSCAEVFVATAEEIADDRWGKSRQIVPGQVGIRCVHCRDVESWARSAQSVSFPSRISGIYSAVTMMQRRHLALCQHIPTKVRQKIVELKEYSVDSCNTPGRQQYWVDAAKEMGLTDTSKGIKFSRESIYACDSVWASPPLVRRNNESQIVSREDAVKSADHTDLGASLFRKESFAPSIVSAASVASSNDDDGALVCAEDQSLVSDYLYLAMEQMQVCCVVESDQVGCYRSRPLGFRGLACKHCGGQPGFGKYFPATVRSLAQTTTSQTIIKHCISKCKHMPPTTRDQIIALVQASKRKGSERPKYGSRKLFFQRIWDRLHKFDSPGMKGISLNCVVGGDSEEEDHNFDGTEDWINEPFVSHYDKKRKFRSVGI